MVMNTLTVSAAVTPEVIKTSISHYLNRKPRRHKPTAHISYDLGLHLVRKFVNYSALHTVEELQAFTSQRVPAPSWARVEDVEISDQKLSLAAKYLQGQLGPDGLLQVGGKEWWQWRRDNAPFKAEWIEMRSDYNQRKVKDERGSRVLLYVHGGAYYFGSVDEHRYQMQRHARKLKARCFAPRYRLAPQFPFPCGLQDCLAAYLHLLSEYGPTSILLAGDSAGAGMVVSMLVVIRDQKLPLPAGAMLLSPWVDLLHTFPSVAGNGKLDYIPSNGFIHKPSASWPPPTLEPDRTMPGGVAHAGEELETSPIRRKERTDTTKPKDVSQGFSEVPMSNENADSGPIDESVLTIEMDGRVVKIYDQIQLYAPNHLLTHPLVSPILQPSLGGLPPLLIQVGGGELLRDEQIYLAHKAAHPLRYPPNNQVLNRYDPNRAKLTEFQPTHVQLQVWEDLCHVGHTLSWTQPAKYMYRAVAQFGAWALSRAQQQEVDIMDEEDESDRESTSSGEERASPSSSDLLSPRRSATGQSIQLPRFAPVKANRSIGRAGDALPPYKDHMIRQRVDRHGKIFDLAPASELPALQLEPSEVGVLKEVPVRKWLKRQEEWNRRFARQKKQLQIQREKQLEQGYVGIPPGEKPPPTALAGRRTRDMPQQGMIKKSWGMSLWSSWGSKHDEVTVGQGSSQHARAHQEVLTGQADAMQKSSTLEGRHRSRSTSSKGRLRSASRTVRDEGQAGERNVHPQEYGAALAPYVTGLDCDHVSEQTVIPLTDTTSTRPTHGGIAYPFKLQVPENSRQSANASMITLNSE